MLDAWDQALLVGICSVFAVFGVYLLIRWVDKSNPFKHSRRVDLYRASMRDHKWN
jgi:hypothetical protein